MERRLCDLQAIPMDESSKRKQSCCPTSYYADLNLVIRDWYSERNGKLTDSWSEYPWIVQIALTTFNEQHLEIVVQIRQPDECQFP